MPLLPHWLIEPQRNNVGKDFIKRVKKLLEHLVLPRKRILIASSMSRKPKVVFDTNIFLSAIIFGANPQVCLELAREQRLQLVTSKGILLEFSQKLRSKFKWREQDIVGVIEGIGKFATIVEPKKKVTIIKADPSDNRVLECALEAKADYVISGDKKHLLSLKKFRSIPIVSAKDFLNTILI